jgi:hypothetical protein
MATATTNYATPKVERNALSIKRAEHRRFFLRETFCPLFDALLHKKKKLAVLHTGLFTVKKS